MNLAAERFLFIRFSQNVNHIVVGFPIVYNQGKSGFLRCFDMLAQKLYLQIAGSIIIVVIQPGFADADDFL